MKIGLAQINPTIGDIEANTQLMRVYVQNAKERGCELLVFPELSICGYPPMDLLYQKGFVQACEHSLNNLVKEVHGIAVICGCPTLNTEGIGRPFRNSAMLFHDGTVRGAVCKTLMPNYDVFDEARYFEPAGSTAPLLFKGLRIGLTICEDIWNDADFFQHRMYGTDPLEQLAGASPHIYINIAASPFDYTKPEFRIRLLNHLARKYSRPFLYVNQVGGQDSLVFDGGSMAVSPDGGISCHAGEFREGLVCVELNPNENRLIPSPDSNIRYTPMHTDEAIFKALVLSLQDYTARCGFKRVVIGLSGGIDSALTAAIAAHALEPQNVLGVLMPSEFTSKESIEDALALADNLGIETITLPIETVFSEYKKTLAPVFERGQKGLEEENLQARIRGALLMAISNRLGHMVLATGNKTELAVGYCTLYGDLVGGYALLSDLPKMRVYSVARHVNTLEGPWEKGRLKNAHVIPERIFTKAPTAELRPNQTDQDDLPPYDVLDAILEEYIEKQASIEEIVAKGFDLTTVKRIITMLHRSEYKRRQAPFGPKISGKAFGYGRRFPVTHNYLY
ncbi:MAG: NAD+ synthase [Deltaproteobacteria bacterium]|nr:NAD+ synthase [Deltaproteobacteria bacterium]